MKIKNIVSALFLIVTAMSFVAIANTHVASRDDGAQLEGTWVVTVSTSAPGFPPSFTALETYSRGGGLVTSNNLPPVPRPGQGAWEKNGDAYSVNIMFFTFDAAGAPNGSIRVRHSVSLVGKEEYEGAGVADFYDAGGNLLFSIDFTSTGERMATEPS